MKKCMNCGKKLGSLEGYTHKFFEKRWFFCSKCYNQIEKKGSPYLKMLKEKYELKEEQNKK